MTAQAKLEFVSSIGATGNALPEVITLPLDPTHESANHSPHGAHAQCAQHHNGEAATSVALFLSIVESTLERGTVRIGRSRQVDVTLDLGAPNNTISRKHAEIICTEGYGGGQTVCNVRDLNSTNGIFVNHYRIMEKRLEHGDVVQFGGAAGVSVGTRFVGSESYVRYRFLQKSVVIPPVKARKRRQSTENTPEASPSARAPKRTAKATAPTIAIKDENVPRKSPQDGAGSSLVRADTASAIATLRGLANISCPVKTVVCKISGTDDKRLSAIEDPTNRPSATDSSTVDRSTPKKAAESRPEKFPILMEVLRDAMCGLCSDVLLDAVVLPCSHTFCRRCWANHVDRTEAKCPVCMRKFHSSERTPRGCASLDLLIAYLLEKVATEAERERWKLRQKQAQEEAARELQAKRAKTGATAQGGSAKAHGLIRAAGSMPGSEKAPSNVMAPVLTEGLVSWAGASQLSSSRGRNADAGVANINGGNHIGRRTRQNSRRSTNSTVDRSTKGKVVSVVRCEGCNEVGHDVGECPHRSDSAVAESGQEDEEDDDDDEE